MTSLLAHLPSRWSVCIDRRSWKCHRRGPTHAQCACAEWRGDSLSHEPVELEAAHLAFLVIDFNGFPTVQLCKFRIGALAVWRTQIEQIAVRVYGFHDFFRIGAAVGTESVNEQPMFAQGCKQPFQGFCLTELYRRIAVSVLYMDDNTAHACHTGEITERFLVGVWASCFSVGMNWWSKSTSRNWPLLKSPTAMLSFISRSFRSSLVLNAYVFPLLAVYVILSVASCLMPRPIVSLLGTWLSGAWLRQGMREVMSSIWSLPQGRCRTMTWRSHPTGNRCCSTAQKACHWLPYPVKTGQINDWRNKFRQKMWFYRILFVTLSYASEYLLGCVVAPS